MTKLNGVREIKVNGRQVGWTTAEHYDSTVVPNSIDTLYGHHNHITECQDEFDLLNHIGESIRNLLGLGYNIYCKGYGKKYNYDALALYNSALRLGMTLKPIRETYWYYLRNVCCSRLDINKYWHNTHKQIKQGEWVPNQEFLETRYQT